MNNYPEYVEVNNKKYKINTDFRVAIKCNQIAEDQKIGDYERALAIIYLLFGEEGLKNSRDQISLLNAAKKFLSCNKEIEQSDEIPDMDFIEDYGYIWASFMSDYNGLDLDKTDMHWWKFMDLMNGLSNSELGNCCVLNNIRNLRSRDLSEIKDPKERERIAEAQKKVQLQKYKKENNLTEKQLQSINDLYSQLNIERS